MLKPDQIPTTGRQTAFQAKQLGYESVSELASSLPKRAVVLDIGAGLSRLGHEVAAQRPDIRWINVDPCYTDKDIKRQAHKDLPSNVQLLAQDIAHGSPELIKLRGQADLVYSYWLLPHLSLESDEPALGVTAHMYDLLKPNGKLIVGPIKRVGFGFISPYRYSGTRIYTTQQPKASVVADIIRSTKLWWLPRLIQLVSNRYGIHVGMRFVGGRKKRAI